MVTVGEVGDICDALKFLVVDAILDLLDDLFRADEVRKLGNDDALLTRANALDGNSRTSLEGTTSGFVSLANTV